MPFYSNSPLDQLVIDEEGLASPLQIEEPVFDGRYWQPCDNEEYMSRTDALRTRIEQGAAQDITVGEWQRWVALDWLVKPGTWEASHRFLSKMQEEGQHEYPDEMKYVYPEMDESYTDLNRMNSVLELGDSAFSSVANACNLGIDLEAAIARKFNIDGPITLRRLQEIVSPPNPFWVPIDMDMDCTDIGTPICDEELILPDSTLGYYAVNAAFHTARLFIGDKTIHYPLKDVNRFTYTADWHADNLLFHAYFAQRWSRSSMAEVVAANFQKINSRVSLGQIDKNLGNRSD
jgi:hypothetical protein